MNSEVFRSLDAEISELTQPTTRLGLVPPEITDTKINSVPQDLVGRPTIYLGETFDVFIDMGWDVNFFMDHSCGLLWMIMAVVSIGAGGRT